MCLGIQYGGLEQVVELYSLAVFSPGVATFPTVFG